MQILITLIGNTNYGIGMEFLSLILIVKNVVCEDKKIM